MKRVPKKLSFQSLKGILEPFELAKLHSFTTLRTFTNLLDVAGIIGIAFLLATIFERINQRSNTISTPFGPVSIPEELSLLIPSLVLVLFLAKSLLSILLRHRTALFLSGVETRLSNNLALDFFDSESDKTRESWKSLSEFQAIATSSLEGLVLFLNARLSVITEAALIFLIVGVMGYFSPVMTLVTCVYMAVTLLILKFLVSSRIQKISGDRIIGVNRYLTSTKDLFSSKIEILAAGATSEWIQRIFRHRLLSARSNAEVFSLTGAPRYVLESSLVLGLFIMSTVLTMTTANTSQIVVTGVFAASGLRLVAALIPLQASYNQMIDGEQKATLVVEKLRNLSSHKDLEEIEYLQAGNGPLSLEFRDVWSEYEAATPVLRGVSFAAVVGGRTAIVGPSGAGKTTCFNLAIGSITPTSGEILIGKHSPSKLLFGNGGVIGIVPQRPNLITGTLAENISFREFASTNLSQVRQCLQDAGLEKYCTTDALKMHVAPDFGQFSGGEIQRISLARALYNRPRILLLDEATSALDAQTESAIDKVLERLTEKMTIVLIAHRLTTVKRADRVIYLDHGRILGEGTYESLMTEVPDFKEAAQILEAED